MKILDRTRAAAMRVGNPHLLRVVDRAKASLRKKAARANSKGADVATRVADLRAHHMEQARR
eukprot:7920936-Alexandrium_andersonii.AAC.1